MRFPTVFGLLGLLVYGLALQLGTKSLGMLAWLSRPGMVLTEILYISGNGDRGILGGLLQFLTFVSVGYCLEGLFQLAMRFRQSRSGKPSQTGAA